MSEEKKSVWPKIAKIIAEFIVAIVTALFASSFVGYDKAGVFQPLRVSEMFSEL